MAGHEAGRQHATPVPHPSGISENVRPARTPGSGSLKESIMMTFTRQKKAKDRPEERCKSPLGIRFNGAGHKPTPQKQAATPATQTARRAANEDSKRKQPATPRGVGKAKQYSQLYLNCGQADFDGKTCPQCGMFYAAGEAQDEKEHAKYHAEVTHGIKAQGLRGARILASSAGKHRLAVVDYSGHPGNAQKKMRQISKMVTEQLELPDPQWLLSVDSKIYLYISGSRPDTEQIVGVAMAQRITRACRTVVSLQLTAQPGKAAQPGAASAGAAQRCDFAARGGARPAGFAADSTDAAGQALQPGCCTPAQRSLAPGDAASPSGNATPQVRGEPMAAGASEATPCRPAPSGTPRHLPGASTAKRQKVTTLDHWRTASQSKAAGGGTAPEQPAQPAASGGSEAATPRLPPRSAAAAAPAADGEVTSPLRPRHPLIPLRGGSTAVSAVASPDAAAGGPRESTAAGGAQTATGGPAASAAAPAEAAGTGGTLPSAGNASLGQQMAGTAAAAATSEQHHQQQQQQQQPGPFSWQTGPAERADCGVRALWVSLESRRQNIATKLLHAVRSDLVPGYVVPLDRIAFSSPTADGMHFAQAYTKQPDVLVYK